MSMTATNGVWNDILEFLSACVPPERILAFRPSGEAQERLSLLLERNRQGTLTDEEEAELNECERMEHLVRLLKTRALVAPRLEHARF